MDNLFNDLIPTGEATGGIFDDLLPEVPETTFGGQVKEAVKGIIPGAVKFGGSVLQGAAGMQKTGQRNAAAFGRDQMAVMDRIDAGENVPDNEDAVGYKYMTPDQRREVRAQMEQAQSEFNPGTVEDSALYRAGETVMETGDRILPASPGYEDSIGRTVGEGLGSVAAGAAASVLGGPLVAGATFSLAGTGEAVDRAIKGGATEEQIIAAAQAGIIPGLTDSVPVETLLGRIPVPGGGLIKIPATMLGEALRVGGRIGFQALIEGIQEGGQEFLQNAIEQNIYNPDQGLGEGVGGAAGMGAGVGGVVETLMTPFRRRGARQRETTQEQEAAPSQDGAFDDLVPTQEAVADTERLDSPRLTPEDRASPIPNDIIDDGKAIVDQATGKEPAPIALPAPTEVIEAAPVEAAPQTEPVAEAAVPVPAIQRAILRKAGAVDEDIDAMSSEERIADVRQAIDGGIAPTQPELDAARTYGAAPVQTAAPALSQPVEQSAPAPVASAPAPQAAPIPRRDIDTDTALTSAGRSVPVTYSVVEASSLVASQRDEGGINPSYPAEMQPRDRSRGVSQQQIQSISQDINPRLLDKSPRASDGAPIIANDGVVESGNGRVLALRKAYAEGRGEGYRSYLAEQGYPVEGMNQPVLVRVREGEMTPEDRRAFTREANERDTLGMSATEQAVADASSMGRNVLSLYRGGDIDQAGNREFVRAFIGGVVNPNDQASMIARDGAMSQQAVRRVQAALLAKAYGDADLVASLVESTDTNIRAIGGALMDVAAEWAQMRAEAQTGTISPAVDQTANLLEAVRVVDRARKDGRRVAEYVGQTDIFTGTSIPAESILFLQLMFRNRQSWTQPAGRDKLADALRFYVTEARKTSAGVDLLGEQAPEPQAILATAGRRQYGQSEGQQPGLDLAASAAPAARQDDRPRGEGRTVEAEPRRDAQDGEGSARAGDQAAGEVAKRPAPEKAPTASWVIREKATGDVVMETFDRKKVDALNTAKYEAVPIQEHLAGLNEKAAANFSIRNDGTFRIRENTAGIETEFVLTEAFVEKAADLTKALRRQLDRAGLSDVNVRVSESITAIVNGEAAPADGRYFRNVIDVALDAADPTATLNHESIHAMRKMGLFSENEWSILSRKSKRDWIGRYKIAETYDGFPDWAQVEEGIAHAYADWAGGARMDGIIAKTFRSIKSFIEALGNALTGGGFKSTDSIFEQVSEGEIAARPRDEFGRFASFSLTERRPVDAQGIPSVAAVSQSLGARMMDSIKRGRNDGETVGQYSHRKLIDYLHPVRTMIEAQGGSVQDTMNAYLQARLTEDAALARIQRMHDLYVTPMIEILAKGGASLEDFHRYLYARHAPERNRVVGLRNEPDSDFYKAATDHNIKGASGWSTNEAKAALRDLQKDQKKFTALQEAGRMMRTMLDRNLLDQKSAGLISDATHKQLTEQWQHYVPLKAEDGTDGDGAFMPSAGRGFDVRGNEFKGATGRFTEAENVVAWAVSQSERTHLRAQKNAVGKSVLRFLNQFDPKGESIARVYWSEGDGFGDIDKAPTVYRRELGKDGKVANRAVPPSTIAADMFSTKVGGKTYYIKFADEKVGLALKKMGVIDLDALSRLARHWTGFQSLVNTRANPAFVPINIIRDAATGAIHLLDEGFSTKEAARIVGDIPKAWGALWRNAREKPGKGEWDASLREYIDAGGKIAFEPQKTVQDSLNELRKKMRDLSEGKSKPRAAWDAFVDFVGDLNDAGENGIRLAAYKAAREKGKSVKQAAFIGRDLTVDFKKRGEIGPLMNSWFVFFNASIQGNYNIAARLASSKKVRQAAFAIAAKGVLIDLLNRALSGDDDDGESYYSKMVRNEPWKLERQIVLFFGPGENDYFSIPLPYGYNAIYHMGLQASAAAHGDTDPMGAILDSTRVAFDAFNPIGSGGTWLNMVAPTILDPAVDIATNKNFAGTPIAPTRYPNDPRPDSEVSFNSTPDWAKGFASWMNWATGGNEIEPGAIDIHPDTVEHIWGYVSGGIGRFFGQVLDTGAKVATGKTDELEPQNVPWVRSFYGRMGNDSRRSEYYSQREEVQSAKSRLDDYKEAAPDQLDDFIERNRVAVESIKAFDAAEKQLRKIRKAKRAVEASDDLSEEEKKERLKPLDENEIAVMNSARRIYAENRARSMDGDR